MAIVILFASMAVACNGPDTRPAGTDRQIVRGVVIAVDGPSAAAVNGFRLHTAEGEVLEFEVGRLELDDGGLPAAHLREHLIDGAPIEVDYIEEDGRRVALRYRDAD